MLLRSFSLIGNPDDNGWSRHLEKTVLLGQEMGLEKTIEIQSGLNQSPSTELVGKFNDFFFRYFF